MPYDPTTPVGQVRLLINDTSASPIFDDSDITAFLTMEANAVKLAAAQALDTIADDEVLTAKVISAQGTSTNGAAVADALRKRADSLRLQYASNDDDGGYFEFIDPNGPLDPELTERPYLGFVIY